jgi:hypothetical protein
MAVILEKHLRVAKAAPTMPAMVAVSRYRAEDEGAHEPWGGRTPARDVLSAWILALLLVVGAVAGFALDHLVTVSPDPVATYGSALEEAAADEAAPGAPGAGSGIADEPR